MQGQKLQNGTIPDIKKGYYVAQEIHVWTGTKVCEHLASRSEI